MLLLLLYSGSCSYKCSEGRGPRETVTKFPQVLVWAQWDWKECHWSKCPRAFQSKEWSFAIVLWKQCSPRDHSHGPVLYHLAGDFLPEKQNRTLEILLIFSCSFSFSLSCLHPNHIQRIHWHRKSSVAILLSEKNSALLFWTKSK